MAAKTTSKGKKAAKKSAKKATKKAAKKATKRAPRKAGKKGQGRKAASRKNASAHVPNTDTYVGRSPDVRAAADRQQLAAALESPSPTVQIGPRVFRLNFATGIAYVVDGPKLPGIAGIGRKQRNEISKALPERPKGTVEGLLGWRLTDEPWALAAKHSDPHERRDHRCQSDKNPEIVFTMGLPGSGKSTVLVRMGMDETHSIIDPDAIKLELPGYDPKKPWLVHGESARRAEAMFVAALRSGTGRHAVDGTGTTAETMIRRIRQAQLAGFYTRVLYVRTTLATALARNAARERVVPEDVIRQKALDIETAVSLLQDVADCFMQVNND